MSKLVILVRVAHDRCKVINIHLPIPGNKLIIKQI